MGKIDTLIANACECEPYITADDSLLRTEPEHVLEGMQILRQILKPERVVLAIEDNKAEAIQKVKELLKDHKEIEVKILPTMYPQGAEKQLVQSVTGREVLPGQLPKSREPRVSCLNPGKTSRDLLQHVSRPESPPMAREQ